MAAARRGEAKRRWDGWSEQPLAKQLRCRPPFPAGDWRAPPRVSPQPHGPGTSGSSPGAADGSGGGGRLAERGPGCAFPSSPLLRPRLGGDAPERAGMGSRPRRPSARELKNKSKDGAGCNFTSGTDDQDVSEEQTVDHRKKRMKDQGSAVIYLKALQSVFGKSLGKTVRREVSASNGDQDQSPCHRKESCRSDGNSESTCAVSRLEDHQHPLDTDRQKTSLNKTNTCANLKEHPVDYQRPAIEGPSPKLVFVEEHDLSSEDDYELKEREMLEKDPSVGSDWSDVEDVESLARFSQEDSVPQHSRSVILETSPVTTDYVMYPAHLYNPPWGDFAKCWTSSPKQPSHCSLSSPSTDASYLDVSGSSHLGDISVELEANASSSTLKNLESAVESGHRRSLSFDSSLVSGKKSKIFSREAESYAPTISRACMSDFSTSKHVDHEATIELPKHLLEGFIDTHCHLDMLYSKMSFKGTFAKFRKVYNSSFPKEFQGCIADFCDPRTLTDFLWEDLLKEDMVWGAFGCHPHFARYYTDFHERNLLQALRHPKAIAFGEMGLDYSYKCSTDISKQHKVFERQLQLAVSLKKPLVIHCREADDDLLVIMKKFVPKDYKIHRHCFTGSYNVIEPLLDYFPNLSVGFTAMLTYSSAFEARETIRKIPLNRIIVETDAPYFLPRQVPKSICQYSHPGLALHTVREIARLKDLPLSRTLAVLRQNTNYMYDL